MKINERTIGDVHVLDCSGKFTLGEGTLVVRNTVRDLLNNGVRKIVLNLADVPFIDSSGVGELVSTYTTVTGRGGEVKLMNPTPKTRDLLSLTKLLTVFEVYDSEQSATASFA